MSREINFLLCRGWNVLLIVESISDGEVHVLAVGRGHHSHRGYHPLLRRSRPSHRNSLPIPAGGKSDSTHGGYLYKLTQI